MRAAICYWLPGGFVEYRGAPKSMLAWIRVTWRGALAAWSIWFRCAWFVVSMRMIPFPSTVAFVFLEVFRNYASDNGMTIREDAR